ncbi:adenosylcobinamide-phosphate synthase CbiB [Novosphingobium beihaiensis]|uniref:Cobalamin biosynthesis protein CobD n=1 Tax=Novosphingobium beihaiensis TaxID=2930389 RepID=A0ABT0BQ40_9SPHN|nr:adenosylcobinamide-phosphate synthase CbiB [Novosphingobium beihaiensis]MCJ2187152.1 adenosylcobinamide-phosphate synthase CbiB [Novosphingobium beihaiensis]
MVEPVALGALALDAALGWPEPLYRRIGHPVGGFARIIGMCETRWNQPHRSARFRRRAGVAGMLALILASGGAAFAAEQAIRALAGPWAWLPLAFAAWPALAQRSLYEHYRPVERALASGDLPAARQAVSWIVGRDTAALDAPGTARAGIESLAESFCDGVIAPLFWLLALGLPGAWIYKAINTADSLIGHPEEPLRDYGWAAARIDDAANLIPSRLSAVLICLAGAGGWRVLWRDHGRHASPNAGWPEAAMAGTLGIRLAGPVRYDGVLSPKPWIGEGAEADAGAMARAGTVYLRACALAWIGAGGVAWLV